HTALASRRPPASQLTEFYLWVALGGALGGIFVATIAPFIFSTVIEYPLLVALVAFFRTTRDDRKKPNWADFAYPAVIALLIAAAWSLFKWAKVEVNDDIAALSFDPRALIKNATLGVDAILVLAAYFTQRHRNRFALSLAVLIAGYRLALPGFLDDYQ